MYPMRTMHRRLLDQRYYYVNGKPVIQRSLCNTCGKCVPACYSKAIEILGLTMTIEQLITEVKKDAIIFKNSHGGVTLSGGEPLYKTELR